MSEFFVCQDFEESNHVVCAASHSYLCSAIEPKHKTRSRLQTYAFEKFCLFLSRFFFSFTVPLDELSLRSRQTLLFVVVGVINIGSVWLVVNQFSFCAKTRESNFCAPLHRCVVKSVNCQWVKFKLAAMTVLSYPGPRLRGYLSMFDVIST